MWRINFDEEERNFRIYSNDLDYNCGKLTRGGLRATPLPALLLPTQSSTPQPPFLPSPPCGSSGYGHNYGNACHTKCFYFVVVAAIRTHYACVDATPRTPMRRQVCVCECECECEYAYAAAQRRFNEYECLFQLVASINENVASTKAKKECENVCSEFFHSFSYFHILLPLIIMGAASSERLTSVRFVLHFLCAAFCKRKT